MAQPLVVTRGLREEKEMARRGIAAPAKGLKSNAVIELFVPVKDSMGETAAVLEVFTAVVKG